MRSTSSLITVPSRTSSPTLAIFKVEWLARPDRHDMSAAVKRGQGQTASGAAFERHLRWREVLVSARCQVTTPLRRPGGSLLVPSFSTNTGPCDGCVMHRSGYRAREARSAGTLPLPSPHFQISSDIPWLRVGVPPEEECANDSLQHPLWKTLLRKRDWNLQGLTMWDLVLP